jgi:DNA-binding transcriptional MerR regulator/methylmalonyl-CoA mutase cobalamin-binding subunit
VKRSGADGPRHRIGAVARLTGLSVHALRAWERRYGTLAPARSSGGTRLFSDADVARLRSIKALLDEGYAIGDVAGLTDAELARVARRRAGARARAGDGAAAEVRGQFLDAVTALDTDRATTVLARAALAWAPRDFVTDIAGPALVEVGERWARGAWCVGQEHAASALVRSCLGALLVGQSSDGRRPVAVAAAPAGELHEFGALFVALLAQASGWQVVYLGASVPATEIATVARLTRARLVLVSVVALAARDAERELREISRTVPAAARILAGGGGLSPALKLPARVRPVRDLGELAL